MLHPISNHIGCTSLHHTTQRWWWLSANRWPSHHLTLAKEIRRRPLVDHKHCFDVVVWADVWFCGDGVRRCRSLDLTHITLALLGLCTLNGHPQAQCNKFTEQCAPPGAVLCAMYKNACSKNGEGYTIESSNGHNTWGPTSSSQSPIRDGWMSEWAKLVG